MARNQNKRKETKYEQKYDMPVSGRGDSFVTDGIQINPNNIELGQQVIQTFELGFWPPSAVPGFTEELLPQHPCSLVIQAIPQSNSETIRKLGNSLSRLQSSAREGQKKGVPDPELERRIQDAYQLRDAVNRGATRFFQTSVSALTYTPDTEKSKLPNVKAEIKRRARERSMEMVSPKWQQEQAYRGAQPGGRSLLPMRLLETNSLAALFPFTDLDHFEDDGIPIGINSSTGNPFILNRWAAKNPHWYVSADSGSGKSYFVKETLSQEVIMGRPVIILDPSAQEEYAPLITSLNGEYITFGAGNSLCINPLEIRPDPEHQDKDPNKVNGRPLSERISLLKPIIATLIGVQPDDTRGEARIDKCLQSVFLKAGFTDSWGSVFHAEEDELHGLRWVPNQAWPVLSDLHHDFVEKGYTEFAESLEPFIKGGTADMLDGQTSINTNNPVIGFGINHLIAVPGAFSRAAYAVVMDYCVGLFGTFRSAKEKLLIVDEAHNLLRDKTMSGWLVRQYREARKAGVGVTAISQSALDALTPEARPIWDNSSARFFLSQPSSTLRQAAIDIGVDPALLTPAAKFPKGEMLVMLEDLQVYKFKSFAPPEMEKLVRADAYVEH